MPNVCCEAVAAPLLAGDDLVSFRARRAEKSLCVESRGRGRPGLFILFSVSRAAPESLLRAAGRTRWGGSGLSPAVLGGGARAGVCVCLPSRGHLPHEGPGPGNCWAPFPFPDTLLSCLWSLGWCEGQGDFVVNGDTSEAAWSLGDMRKRPPSWGLEELLVHAQGRDPRPKGHRRPLCRQTAEGQRGSWSGTDLLLGVASKLPRPPAFGRRSGSRPPRDQTSLGLVFARVEVE